MKFIKVIILILFSISSFKSVLAQKSGVALADSAYSAGRYEEAVELYSNLAEQEGVSAPLLFNLGNAAFKASDYGKAVLAYERAKRLDPGNKEIQNNLNVAINKVEDANRAELKGKRLSVTPDDASFFKSVYLSIAEEHSSNFWGGWAAVCFILGMLCIAVYLFTSGVTVRKIGFFGSIAFLFFSLLTLCFSFMAAAKAVSTETVVLTEYKVSLHALPDEESKSVSSPLTRGTMMQILEVETDSDDSPRWYKVRLNHDFVGWVKAEDVEII